MAPWLGLLAAFAFANGRAVAPFPSLVGLPAAPLAVALAPAPGPLLAPSATPLGLPLPAPLVAPRALAPAAPTASADVPRVGGLAVADGARLFDGARPAGQAPPPAVPVRPRGFSARDYLRSTLAEDQAFIDSAANELRRTRAGRQVLGGIEQLAVARGRPVPVELAEIRPLAGEFSFDTEVVRLKRSLVKKGAEEAAAVLGHELVHALQLAQGLPSDLFEMELEAYMLDIRIAVELGGEYGGSDWDRKVEKYFRKGVRPLVDFLLDGLYKNDASVIRLGIPGLIKRVAGDIARDRRRIAKLEETLAKRRESAAALRRMNHPVRQVRAYADDELRPLERKLRDAKRSLAWHEADLALLSTAEGRERVERYSKATLELARRTRRWYLSLNKPGR